MQYLLVHIIIMQSIHSRVFGIVCRYPSCWSFSDHNDTKNLIKLECNWACSIYPYHHHAILSFKSFWNCVQISKLQPAFSKHACVPLVRITCTVTHVAPTPSLSPSFRQRNIIMRKYHIHAWDWCWEMRKCSYGNPASRAWAR